MSSALAVVQNAALMSKIVEFQEGLYGDLAEMLTEYYRETHLNANERAKSVLIHLTARETIHYLKRYNKCLPQALTTRHIDAAAELGFMKTVEYLCSIGLPLSLHALPKAAAEGNLNVVQFLFFHIDKSQESVRIALNHASHRGQMAVVQFLYEHRSEELTIVPIVCAANGGQYEIERYLRERFVSTLVD